MRISDRFTTTAPRIESPSSRTGTSTPVEETFAATLGKALEDLNQKQQEVNDAVSQMLGGTGEIHDAMIALHEAEEAIEVAVAIRNKLVQAYQDIMRMPL